MSWEAALWWLPTAAVAGMIALGLAAAAKMTDPAVRRSWTMRLLVYGAVALALTAWEQVRSRTALVGETTQLQELGARIDQLGRLLPGDGGRSPGDTFDTATNAIVALNAKIKDLEGQIEQAQEMARRRRIAPETATKLADFLRPFGSRRVVVSCAPDDVEAFDYGTQLASVLRNAGWDALGPEKTAIFGEAPSMAVKLYVRPGEIGPDTAGILVDAFNRFSIALQSGVAPTNAIPDPATVELFVSHKS